MMEITTGSINYVSRPDKNGGFSMRSDGSVTVYRSQSKKVSKPKRLPYNFKALSSKILKAKTPEGARQALSEARRKAGTLRKQLRGGEYDDKEISAAIIHAEAMKRIARKKMKNLEQEQRMEDKNGVVSDEGVDEQDEEERVEDKKLEETADEQLDEIMEELEEMEREQMQAMQEMEGLDELMDQMKGESARDMSPEDIEKVKKKHRMDEQKAVTEADMKYLKALFYKLAKEKQEAVSGGSGSDAGQGAGVAVSVQLGGMDMPVQTVSEAAPVEGGAIDAAV